MAKKTPAKKPAAPRKLEVHVNPVQLRLDPEWTTRVSGQLDELLTRTQRLLMANAEVIALLKRMDAATDNIAADVARLTAGVTTGMSDAEVAEVKALGESIVSKLEGLAASTEDPIPSE